MTKNKLKFMVSIALYGDLTAVYAFIYPFCVVDKTIDESFIFTIYLCIEIIFL